MNVPVVCTRQDPKSFDGAGAGASGAAVREARQHVRASDLYAMNSDLAARVSRSRRTHHLHEHRNRSLALEAKARFSHDTRARYDEILPRKAKCGCGPAARGVA